MNRVLSAETETGRNGLIYRKIFHLIAAPIIPVAYYFEFLPRETVFGLAGMTLLVWLPIDLIRIYHKGSNSWVKRHFWRFFKDTESRSICGATFMLIGILFSLALFEPVLACAAILFNAIGDPLAAIVGTRFGKLKFSNGKSFEGFAAMLVVCFAISVQIIGFGAVAIVGAFSASTIEFFTGRVDDNLSIPVVSGTAMTIAEYVL